ncbi:hypothetical protein OG562_23235 [Streptomyces sp. NBC_01275]|uniref:hypothetical protein n=1 Tax=Streptomyces sp. NBC_01275 TaxID=2903807 RepID=UPI002255ABD8|nr:hypothetical protein [Streptomyces sp. NBC_01275]MCX4763828.1 hypothetical protein [Streptomyces sp. NBC_01275]
MAARLCFVVLDHAPDDYFDDLVRGIRRFCPGADLHWYDSSPADRPAAPPTTGVPRLECSRPLTYAKVTPYFFDMLEWAADRDYDHVVNVESDMAFVNAGFEEFLATAMAELDYMAPRFARKTPKTSRWRPYRSLRPELPELFDILGIDHTNEAFSPGQVFSRRYVQTLLAAPWYPRLRAFVERNQEPGRSFTLQEVLLPTLADVLDLRAADYPAHMTACNRYRPYHAASSVARARRRGDVPFVHPVRRDGEHEARRFVRALYDPVLQGSEPRP